MDHAYSARMWSRAQEGGLSMAKLRRVAHALRRRRRSCMQWPARDKWQRLRGPRVALTELTLPRGENVGTTRCCAAVLHDSVFNSLRNLGGRLECEIDER
eukprot:6186660-Pleurochrysis_carterae.AAC.1